ncbi:hypothetical protein ACTXT7_002769 [Hymenolepis weldensis]
MSNDNCTNRILGSARKSRDLDEAFKLTTFLRNQQGGFCYFIMLAFGHEMKAAEKSIPQTPQLGCRLVKYKDRKIQGGRSLDRYYYN